VVVFDKPGHGSILKGLNVEVSQLISDLLSYVETRFDQRLERLLASGQHNFGGLAIALKAMTGSNLGEVSDRRCCRLCNLERLEAIDLVLMAMLANPVRTRWVAEQSDAVTVLKDLALFTLQGA
jgi:hypothetical protein